MNKNIVAAIISVASLLGFMGVMVVLLFIKIPPENENLFNMSLMALVAIVNQGAGFYVGSSVGSAKKDEVIQNLTAPQNGAAAKPAP